MGSADRQVGLIGTGIDKVAREEVHCCNVGHVIAVKIGGDDRRRRVAGQIQLLAREVNFAIVDRSVSIAASRVVPEDGERFERGDVVILAVNVLVPSVFDPIETQHECIPFVREGFAASRVVISLVREFAGGFTEAIAPCRAFIPAMCKASTRRYVAIGEHFMAFPTVSIESPRLSTG